ncbi:hypothetical protein LUZ60_014406 [Juncus effusus]|nr:hypothetical protein LUZ60_014406 [Juncus effusus]
MTIPGMAGVGAGRRSRNRPIIPLPKPFLFLLLSLSLLLLYYLSPPPNNSSSLAPLCSPSDERFLFYAPHSGFSNQVGELKNALVISAILNRTLIVPPVLDHHSVVLGSCPKFRVSEPAELRAAVWDHILELIRDRRYISIADIVDISSVSPSTVKTIDFRVFASIWCGLDIKKACSSSLCCSLSSTKSRLEISSQCRSLITGDLQSSDCVYNVQEDCRNTIWTYQQNNHGKLDSFQPDIKLQKRKKINYVRKRKDIYKSLGPSTKADSAKLLAFGTVFSALYKGSESYIDIHESIKDSKIKSLIDKIEFLPFSQEIIRAGKEFAENKIKGPFLCAQLRLLDGQFKNHWKNTFSALKQKLETLNQARTDTINIFIMTDLPKENWTETYLQELQNNKRYKIFTLNEKDELVIGAAKRVLQSELGLKSGFVPNFLDGLGPHDGCGPGFVLPDVLLHVEESVCSCASLGFVGTAGSTIGENIENMRKYNVWNL